MFTEQSSEISGRGDPGQLVMTTKHTFADAVLTSFVETKAYSLVLFLEGKSK